MRLSGTTSSAEKIAPIAITDNTMSPPSTIEVSGFESVIEDVNVRLNVYSHTQPADVNVLLVGPQGQTAMIMSNVAGASKAENDSLILDESGTIGPDALPEKVRLGTSHRGSLIIDSPTLTLEELEKEYILKVLNHTRWQKKRTSEILGITPSTLYRKLVSYGVEKPGREDSVENGGAVTESTADAA